MYDDFFDSYVIHDIYEKIKYFSYFFIDCNYFHNSLDEFTYLLCSLYEYSAKTGLRSVPARRT